jgi:hypothetical protein
LQGRKNPKNEEEADSSGKVRPWNANVLFCPLPSEVLLLKNRTLKVEGCGTLKQKTSQKNTRKAKGA